MNTLGQRHAAYSHSVLVHDTDEQLIEGTRAFVAQGLESGGDVLVHGSRDRVDLMRDVLGSHSRLGYGLDEELYLAPMRTLFAYQRTLAERPSPTQLWVIGTVPLAADLSGQAAWLRYESVVDAALGAYAFAALCTYDTRTCPDSVIRGALATHRTVSVDLAEQDNALYVEPAVFLEVPLAQRPEVPDTPPTDAITIHDIDDLAAARDLVKVRAYEQSAVSPQCIEQFRVAVTEITSNGLSHGRPPVTVALWADVGRLTCLVEDSGTGHLDPMTGYRHPDHAASLGLWAARQLVDDLVIGCSESGGCSVLLTLADEQL